MDTTFRESASIPTPLPANLQINKRPRLHRGTQHRFRRWQVRPGDAGRAAIVGARTHSCRSARRPCQEQSAYRGRIHHVSAGVLQRDRKEEGKDPWDNLDPSDRKEVEELLRRLPKPDCLARSRATSPRKWPQERLAERLTRTLNRIGELNSDEDIDEVEHSLNSYRRFIERNVTIYANEWAKVKKRYLDERQWLLSRAARSTDTIKAANYLDELYKQVTDWLNRGATLCITDEEYLFLKQTLDQEKHLWGRLIKLTGHSGRSNFGT